MLEHALDLDMEHHPNYSGDLIWTETLTVCHWHVQSDWGAGTMSP
jgi:hypothetical protein